MDLFSSFFNFVAANYSLDYLTLLNLYFLLLFHLSFYQVITKNFNYAFIEFDQVIVFYLVKFNLFVNSIIIIVIIDLCFNYLILINSYWVNCLIQHFYYFHFLLILFINWCILILIKDSPICFPFFSFYNNFLFYNLILFYKFINIIIFLFLLFFTF